MEQNPSWDACKPGDHPKEAPYLYACQQGFLHQVLNYVLLGDQIIISLTEMQINL